MRLSIANISGVALSNLPYPVSGSMAIGETKTFNLSQADVQTGLERGNTPWRAWDVQQRIGHVTLTWSSDPTEIPLQMEDILVGNSGLASITARKVYVSKSGYVENEADGSIRYPFLLVQDAIDYVVANMAPSATSPVVIDIGPGVFAENLIIRGVAADAIIFQGAGDSMTVIQPAAGAALVITNSTLVGLVAYQAAFNYALLVNDTTAGPQSIYLKDLQLVGVGAGQPALEALGVMGDAAADQTDFLTGGLHLLGGVRLTPGAAGNALHARNAGACILNEGNALVGNVLIRQVAAFREHSFRVGGTFTIGFDVADPQGYFAGGFVANQFDGGRITGKAQFDTGSDSTLHNPHCVGELETNGTASLVVQGGFVGGDLDGNGTSTVRLLQSHIEGDADFAAGANLAARASSIYGDATFAAGAGTVELFATPVNGTITDAGAKLGYDTFTGQTEARDALLLLPAVGFLDNGAAAGITANGSVNIAVNGNNLLNGQTFAAVTIGASLEIIACRPGTVGNDYSVEIIDSGVGALALAWAANTLTVDLGGAASTEDQIATAINTVATSPVATIIRANSGGGAAPGVTALVPLTGGTGRGFSASINGVNIPILHDNGAATSVANLTEVLATLNPPDLTGVAPAMAANDDVALLIVSNGHAVPPVSSTLV